MLSVHLHMSNCHKPNPTRIGLWPHNCGGASLKGFLLRLTMRDGLIRVGVWTIAGLGSSSLSQVLCWRFRSLRPVANFSYALSSITINTDIFKATI